MSLTSINIGEKPCSRIHFMIGPLSCWLNICISLYISNPHVPIFTWSGFHGKHIDVVKHSTAKAWLIFSHYILSRILYDNFYIFLMKADKNFWLVTKEIYSFIKFAMMFNKWGLSTQLKRNTHNLKIDINI